jgi:hypothetical protein
MNCHSPCKLMMWLQCCRWTGGGVVASDVNKQHSSRSDDVGNLVRKSPTRQIHLPTNLHCPYARRFDQTIFETELLLSEHIRSPRPILLRYLL